MRRAVVKAARTTDLGQAINYRFKRDDKGWRVFVTTEMQEPSLDIMLLGRSM